MEASQPTNVRALIRAARETKMDLAAVEPEEEDGGEPDAARLEDPRFVEPARRQSVPEDSGTYSVVFRRDD